MTHHPTGGQVGSVGHALYSQTSLKRSMELGQQRRTIHKTVKYLYSSNFKVSFLRLSTSYDYYLLMHDLVGTAIYVFFILSNAQPAGISTKTAANFTLDGQLLTEFTHEASTEPGLLYNQTVFSKEGLEYENHTLRISTTGQGDESLYVNFDYAIYTYVNLLNVSCHF